MTWPGPAHAPLSSAFFEAAPVHVAPALLGAVLVVESSDGPVAVRLTEVEAYDGEGADPGSHAYRGERPRNAVMFGEPGGLYVYFTYGMHYCANLVCRPAGSAGAVLLRAGEVVRGEDLALARRWVRHGGARRAPDPVRDPARDRARFLARGPGNLAQALGLTTAEHSGLMTTRDDGPVRVYAPDPPVAVHRVRVGPRVGVAGPGGEEEAFPWRFWIEGEPSVSAYRPAAPRRRAKRVSGDPPGEAG